MSVLASYTLPGTIYIASDIHLGPHIPSTNQAFFSFLAQASEQADALILLGDIFNVWFGDDVALNSSDSWLVSSLSHIRLCAQQIPVYFVHGNRDFLMGKVLYQQLGVQALPDQCLLQTDAGIIFISHGDELCTHDTGYMRLRRLLRNATIQKLFLNLPLSWRQKIAHYLRQRSHSTQQQSLTYHQNYDINPVALQQIIQHYPNIDYIVHGHTHKEAIHPINSVPGVIDKARIRYVLSDWELDNSNHVGFLSIHKKGLTLRKPSLLIPSYTPK